MIKEIEELLNEQILIKSAELFGTTRAQLQDLGGFESHVYEFERNGQAYILKITHTIRRTVNYLLGELEFVNHLAEKEVSVSKAVKSINGRLVEEIPAVKGCFLAYVFEKAPGNLLEEEGLSAQKLYKWGQLTASINLHSQSFQPSDIAYQRNYWKNDILEYFNRFVPESEKEVRDKLYTLIEKIDRIPKTKESFGLTHTDLHQWNLFHHNGELKAFDFDDCAYHYFVHEIAAVLYFTGYYADNFCGDRFKNSLGIKTGEYTDYFKEQFISGYKSILPISDEWVRVIPDFIRIKHLVSFAAHYQRYLQEKEPKEKENIKQVLEHDKKDIFNDNWADVGFEKSFWKDGVKQ